MKCELWWVGKTNADYLKEGIAVYTKRLSRYTSFAIKEIADQKNAKNLSTKELKNKEGLSILERLEPKDYVILLDENGKSYTSVQFAKQIEKLQNASYQKIIFIIGGAYGFSEALYQRSQTKMALSTMTFSHQMVRMIFCEQLYRAFSINNNEPYHHQ